MNRKEAAELFNDSYNRCISDPTFLDVFYDLFLASSTEVKERFEDTDFDRQKRMLRASILHVMLANSNPDARSQLDRVAESHSARGYNITPELYELWRSCMLTAVEICDPQFNDQIRKAWEKIIDQGIEYMVANYR